MEHDPGTHFFAMTPFNERIDQRNNNVDEFWCSGTFCTATKGICYKLYCFPKLAKVNLDPFFLNGCIYNANITTISFPFVTHAFRCIFCFHGKGATWRSEFVRKLAR